MRPLSSLNLRPLGWALIQSYCIFLRLNLDTKNGIKGLHTEKQAKKIPLLEGGHL